MDEFFFMEQAKDDPFCYLLGDILSIGPIELCIIFGVAAATVGIITIQWRNLLSMTVNRDLAAVEGVPLERTRFLLIFLLASLIPIVMKLVGMLLIIAMVIMPAAVAQQFSRTQERMVVTACSIGIASLLVAVLFASMEFDLPAGQANILVSGSVFVVGQRVSVGQCFTFNPFRLPWRPSAAPAQRPQREFSAPPYRPRQPCLPLTARCTPDCGQDCCIASNQVAVSCLPVTADLLKISSLDAGA